MASARRTGTNEVVLTYGAGGGYDYDTDSAETWQDWEDDTTENMTAGGTSTSHVLEMAAGSYSDSVLVDGATQDSSYFRICRPVSGDEHDGDPTAGVIITRDDGAWPTCRIDDFYTSAQDLRIDIACNSAAGGEHVAGNWGDYTSYVGIYVASATNDNAIGVNNGMRLGGGDNNFGGAVDCIVTGVVGGAGQAGRGYYMGANGWNAYAYNCIAEGNTTQAGHSGMDSAHGGATLVAKNCISQNNNGQDGIDANFAQTTCHESTGVVVLFTNSAAGDYTLQSGDTTAKGEGTDLSGDGTFAFDDDIARVAWTDWSMGVHEFVAAAGTSGFLTGVGGSAGGGFLTHGKLAR